MKSYIRKIKFEFEKGEPVILENYDAFISLSMYVNKLERHYYKGENDTWQMMTDGIMVFNAELLEEKTVSRLLEFNDIVEIHIWYDPEKYPDVYIPKYISDDRNCNKRQVSRLLDKLDNGLEHDRLIITWNKRNKGMENKSDT